MLTRGSAVSEAQRLAVEREAVRGEHEAVEDKHQRLWERRSLLRATTARQN